MAESGTSLNVVKCVLWPSATPFAVQRATQRQVRHGEVENVEEETGCPVPSL